MDMNLYKRTFDLIKLIVKRNWITISIWIISIIAINVMVVGAFTELYSSQEEMFAMAETMKNPAMTVMVGPSEGLDNYHVGAQMSHQMLLFTAIAVSIMAILIVNKNTRADEEEGLIEMIRSLPVGRLSVGLAINKVMSTSFILLFLLMTIFMYLTGIENITLEGSLVYAATLAVTGMFFSSLTLVFAQLAENSRSTIFYSFAFLMLAYLIRAVGDVSSEMLSLISPLGLILRTYPYVINNWWPILIMFVWSVLLFGLALYLNSIRDLGSGFIASKPGRNSASKFLKTPLGLYLRLQRTSIIAWFITMFLLGVTYGSIFGDLEQFILSNEMIQQLIEANSNFSLSEQFMTVIMLVMAIIGTIPAVIFALKIRSEEKKKRIENILSKSVSKNELLLTNLIISLVLGFLMLILSAYGLYFASSQVMDDPISLFTMLKSIVVYYPAMLIMIGLAIFLNGIYEKATPIVWLYIAYSFFVSYLGDLLNISEIIIKTTPFGNIPNYPVGEIKVIPLLVMILIAIILIVIGFITYNKRDIKEQT